MTTTQATVDYLPTTIPGVPDPYRPDRLVIVDDPDLGSVPVRWRLGTPGSIWKCSACGLMTKADCAHTFSAGLRLAQDLLGLTPANIPTERTHP